MSPKALATGNVDVCWSPQGDIVTVQERGMCLTVQCGHSCDFVENSAGMWELSCNVGTCVDSAFVPNMGIV